MEQNSSFKLNEFASIDYKKPLGKELDMRTSSYIGHKFMDDTKLGNKLYFKCKESRPYVEDPVLENNRTTDYKANYVWKFGNPDEIRNVSLGKGVDYIKPFYECNLRFLSRPMRPAISVSHSHYIRQPCIPTLPIERAHIPTAVSSTKVVIDRNNPGCSKYLDPSATTASLDYCYRSPKDVLNGIAAQDSITFWNWKDIEMRNKNVFRVRDKQLCDKLPTHECTKRHCEFTSIVKRVPNSGLTTEVRENFVNPNDRAIVFKDDHIQNDFTFMTSVPEMAKTEYNVLGSGDCTHKYV